MISFSMVSSRPIIFRLITTRIHDKNLIFFHDSKIILRILKNLLPHHQISIKACLDSSGKFYGAQKVLEQGSYESCMLFQMIVNYQNCTQDLPQKQRTKPPPPLFFSEFKAVKDCDIL